ncbi:hypothetical protein CRI94_02005 [Longibacter salinarum]|uniref:Cell division protein FtsX n=1 Tax=Longibacter salinarum TaxID=1850348 RepID=A0A2A8D2C4_9BACT|nr:ABC transporter permease [Longibacter salinarum]PEN15085.1 hypothetical protein CRI94_02005 [Longibacter salinarum]
MLRNYFKIALRTLCRRKSYAAINVGGFAVGLASVILIGLWIQDELSYDSFHESSDRTYRVLRQFDLPEIEATIPATPSALAPAIEGSVRGIEQVVSTVGAADAQAVVYHESAKFIEKGVFYAGEGFLDVFTFPLKRGESMLERPGTVLLTESMAEKYFPNQTAIGEMLMIDERSLEVTGVLSDVPSNSSLSFDFLVSLKTINNDATWFANDYITYVQLQDGVSKQEVEQRVIDVVSNAFPRPEEAKGSAFIPHLQPLTGIHLGQGVPVTVMSMPGGSQSDILYVWLFGGLAVFVLILACINFTNLATARSSERANEVGVRKALGARREQLAGQFLGEAFVMSGAATILAVLIAWAGMPFLNAISGKDVSLWSVLGAGWVFALPVLAVIVGFAAGVLPACVLSRFETTDVLQGTYTKGQSGRRFRQGLVIFQFAVTIAVLAGAAVIHQQLDFMRGAGLGFEEENVLVVENTDMLGDQISAFMQELERLPGVTGEAASSYAMPGDFFWNGIVEASDPDMDSQNVNYTSVGWNYTDALGISMVEGRSFSPERTDSSAILINRAAAHSFGWTPEQAVGKSLAISGGATIIGVTENYHYESLHEKIYPLVLRPPTRAQKRVAVRLSGTEVPSTIASVRDLWEEFSGLSFEYDFLASSLAAQYHAEARVAKIFAAAAFLAIVVACLGLLGLAAFTAERRKKEIGIRKALGASVQSIVALLSKDFIALVILGFAIAVPVAWYGMDRWLDSFAYRTEPGPLVFIAVGILALLVALTTVSWQAFDAARSSPRDALQDK